MHVQNSDHKMCFSNALVKDEKMNWIWTVKGQYYFIHAVCFVYVPESNRRLQFLKQQKEEN